MSAEQNACYSCVHRREIPGDAHSRCGHPAVPQADPLVEIMALMGGRLLAGPMPVTGGPKVKGNPHGIRNGWFNWPLNFDPVWLDSCDSHEAKA